MTAAFHGSRGGCAMLFLLWLLDELFPTEAPPSGGDTDQRATVDPAG
jgi:hypothetical protein